ncbi:MAG: tetratricopeptide repeat protein [Candidatus Omnitrophica bacterium]|nr:tetratricopeptide repeat protein [Candidatus Omnitrophota bacterium]
MLKRHFVWLLICFLGLGAYCPQAKATYFDSGNSLFEKGEYEKAIEMYQMFAEAHPDHDQTPGAYMSVASAYYWLGQYQSALEALEQVSSRDQTITAWVQSLKAACYLSIEAYDQAKKELDPLLRKLPDPSWEEDVRIKMARALIGRKEWDKAVETLEPLREKESLERGLEVAYYYAIAGTKDNPEETRAALEAVARQDPGPHVMVKVYGHFGMLSLAGGNFKKALEEFQKAYDLNPKGLDLGIALYGLAYGNQQLQAIEAATKYTKEFVRLFPDHPRVIDMETWMTEQGLATSGSGQQLSLVRLAGGVPAATNLNVLTLTGVAAAGAQLWVNDKESVIDDTGRFNVQVMMEEGENILALKAVGSDGAPEEAFYRVLLDTVPPRFENVDVQIDRRGALTASGKIDVGSSVLVNGKRLKVDEKGFFQGVVDRIPRQSGGSRTVLLEFVAQDLAGNEGGFVFKDDRPPDRPVTPRAQTVSSDLVVLSWEMNTEPDFWGFDLYYSNTGGGDRLLVTDDIIQEREFYIDGVVLTTVKAETGGSGKVDFWIVAVDKVGNESVDSERLSVTIPIP